MKEKEFDEWIEKAKEEGVYDAMDDYVDVHWNANNNLIVKDPDEYYNTMVYYCLWYYVGPEKAIGAMEEMAKRECRPVNYYPGICTGDKETLNAWPISELDGLDAYR